MKIRKVTKEMQKRFWEHSINPITGFYHSDKLEQKLLNQKDSEFDGEIMKNFNQ